MDINTCAYRTCNECGVYKQSSVKIGEPEEGVGAYICIQCIGKAFNMTYEHLRELAAQGRKTGQVTSKPETTVEPLCVDDNTVYQEATVGTSGHDSGHGKPWGVWRLDDRIYFGYKLWQKINSLAKSEENRKFLIMGHLATIPDFDLDKPWVWSTDWMTGEMYVYHTEPNPSKESRSAPSYAPETKPPLGPMPHFLWLEARAEELNAAITRATGHPYPNAVNWVDVKRWQEEQWAILGELDKRKPGEP